MTDEIQKYKATYTGPPGHVLLDGTELIPGETIVEVGAFELESDYWQPANAAAKKALAAHQKATGTEEAPADEPEAEAPEASDTTTTPEGDS